MQGHRKHKVEALLLHWQFLSLVFQMEATSLCESFHTAQKLVLYSSGDPKLSKYAKSVRADFWGRC